MRIILIGNGGRESALAWKMSQSSKVKEVIVIPGNSGMKRLSAKIDTRKISDRHDYVQLHPDLVVIGPEAPLSEGLTDFFETHRIPVLGPTQKASQLESSKEFCKKILKLADIPTAHYEAVSSLEEGTAVMNSWKKEGVVVKVDALAQGKGVIVCTTTEEALEAMKGFFDGSYLGYPVEKLLLEEKLSGPEVSAFALCDGENFVYLGSATDYKRLEDDDLGPNTGGMGTISPSPIINAQDEAWIKEHVFAPTLRVMKEQGTPFKGFLFAGLMKTATGFYTLEFNTRMGDPETQSLLPRIEDDLVPYFSAAAKGELQKLPEIKTQGVAIHVVMSAEGYPGTGGAKIRKGDLIRVGALENDTLFFTAGVSGKDENMATSGGRICGLTVVGQSLKSVRTKIYSEIQKVQFTGMHYRQDIGKSFV